MNGMEMMVSAIVKSLGLNPEDLKTQASNIQQIVVNLDARLTTMANDIAFIKERLADNGQREPRSLAGLYDGLDAIANGVGQDACATQRNGVAETQIINR